MTVFHLLRGCGLSGDRQVFTLMMKVVAKNDFSILEGIESLDLRTLRRLIDILTAVHHKSNRRETIILSRLRQILEVRRRRETLRTPPQE